MKAQKFSNSGKFLKDVELPEFLFKEKLSKGAIFDAIKAENANMRSGNHSTKDRGEVRGGGKKPWSQKGTGRARQGSSRAPHWVGGGVIHGPKKRDYSIRLSRNVKNRAVVSILQKKAYEEKLKLLEDISLNEFNTKAVFQIFKNMNIEDKGRFSLIVANDSLHLKNSARNIKNLQFINAKRIACRELLYNNNLVITDSAMKELEAKYGA
ncbi:MAG: 50S ribosomal protein L4 [Leptospiraceae bacterium]|nr:50S ribosomal protein L4 [Leptospiraceae bacterium]MCK6380131.1 50S ribosomal protein L4 [Leptospiraceae bacterium]